MISNSKEWVVHSPDSGTVRALVDALGCPPPIATVLANRDVTDPDDARQFLDPSPAEIHSPHTLPDVDEAVERLERAIDRNESVVVYVDRDVDGVSGGAILVTLLRDFGVEVDVQAPGKWDGYGLKAELVEEIAANGTDLLVTVDCGTTAHAAIDRARNADINVIVMDHHHVEEGLPTAVACVNPRRDDSPYPNEHLAGGAVAFKVGQRLVESYSPLDIEDYHRYALPLAGLATLGDYMPLNTENRAIAREGFSRLSDSGLTGLVETVEDRNVESIQDLAWSLVPFLNAAKEDESGELMLDLLLADDQETIEALHSELEDYREQVQAERRAQQAHLEACFDRQVDPGTHDLFIIETEEYVGGVPMMRLSEEWGKPVITYRRKTDHYRGGGRSDPNVDFIDLFGACSELLDEFWGHPGAAGFSVSEDNLEPFLERLRQEVRTRYDTDEFRPTLEIDGRLTCEEIDRSFVDQIDRLRPFGTGNDEPSFLLEGVEIGDVETFGESDQHCKLMPKTDSVAFTHWDGAAAVEPINHPARYDFVGTVGWDGYADRPAVTVSDFRVVEEAVTPN